MSGPTGIQGFEGPKGITGGQGRGGIEGPQGVQGERGEIGFAGTKGLDGATGIQLYGNGSLIQCLSRIGELLISSSSGVVVEFDSANPGVTGMNGPSSTISGRYGDTGLNAYSSPLNVSGTGTLLSFPPGTYFLTAVLETNGQIMTYGFYTFLVLSSFNGLTYTDIVTGTPAAPGSQTHLQHYFTPTQDTVVSLRAVSSLSGNALFTNPSSGEHAVLSIVRIW